MEMENHLMDEFEDGPLCEGCNGIDIEKLTSPGGYQYLTTDASMQCPLCKVFGIPEHSRTTNLEFGDKEPKVDYFIRRTFCRATTFSSIDGPKLQTLTDIFTNEGDPAEGFGVCPRIQLSNTGSPRTYKVARDWIQDCHIGHKGCFKDFEPSKSFLKATRFPQRQWPARLIDLNAHEEDSKDARLVEVGSQYCPVYVTLSYCWGLNPDKRHTTTAETLFNHQIRIAYDRLPLTLKHAFDITRKLNVRYIWIDALCIIQGSKEDWEKESAKMYRIYRNSFVTIAADSSPGSSSGCFNDSSTSFDMMTRPVKISAKLSDGRNSCLYIGKTNKSENTALSLDWERTILDKCILAGRGWTFQERILSPRILHYTHRQVFWECDRGLLGEDRLWGHYSTRPLAQAKNIDSREVFKQWQELIKQYSQRKLSEPTDRLPAISGLARVFQKRLSSRYLAGLWFDGLYQGLAWRRHGPLCPLPPAYICPSFSWAYQNSQVNWPIPMSEYVRASKVEKIELHLDGPDPFGRLSEGSLTMTGHLKQFLVTGPVSGTEYKPNATFYSETPDQSKLTLLDGQYVAVAYMDVDPGPQSAVCLLLSVKYSDERQIEHLCVLLLEGLRRRGGEYKRTGIAWVSTTWKVTPPREFFEGWSPPQTITIV